jgi:hypothetical protein
MKKIFIFTAILGLLPSFVFADTVYLKNGKSFKSNVVKKEGNYVIVEEKGFPNKYYNFEIDHIEPEKTAEDANSLKFQDVSKIQDKDQLVLMLLEVNGTKQNLKKNFDSVLAQAQGEKKDKLQEILSIDKVLDIFVPIYKKYYSEDDLRGLIKFYQSPTGQKFQQVSPFIIQETVESSIKYFKEKQSELDALK